MADLNALIAQGAQFQAPPDPFVQYGRMQQLEQGQQANALNQMKMDEYQRGLQEQNALRGLDPASATYLQDVTRINPNKGFEYGQKISAAAASKATQERQNVDAAAARQGMLGQAYRDISSRPSDANITAHMEDVDASTLFNTEEKNAVKKLSQNLLAMPFEQRGAFLASQGAKSSDLIVKPTPTNLARLQAEKAALPVGDPRIPQYDAAIAKESQFAPTPLSDTARLIKERDALPLNDPNRALYDRQIKDLGATAQNARDRLAFDREKLAYERANPGKTIKEVTQADGSTQVFAIDNRSGMATQVMMAGAPGAAPTGAGRGAEGVTGDRVGPATPLVGAKPLNAQMNEGERKAATLLQRLQFSESQLTDALLDDPDAAKPGLFASAVAKLSTPLANTLTPETRQRVESAQLDILDAALTLGTGAAYTSEQLEGYRKSYFPQIGDSPKAILDKQARLNNVIAAAKIAAGRAEKLVPAPVPAAGASDVRNAADKIIAPKSKP